MNSYQSNTDLYNITFTLIYLSDFNLTRNEEDFWILLSWIKDIYNVLKCSLINLVIVNISSKKLTKKKQIFFI